MKMIFSLLHEYRYPLDVSTSFILYQVRSDMFLINYIGFTHNKYDSPEMLLVTFSGCTHQKYFGVCL